MSDAPLARFLALLAEERAAILSGHYGALAAIGAAKQDLIAAALRAGPAGSGLARGLAALRHNQVLLTAALGGLRGAARAAAGAGGFMTYGRDGRRAAVGPETPGFERRA